MYFPFLGDQEAVLDEIEEFLTGVRPPARSVLATVLYTDIVGSTRDAPTRGDARGANCWTTRKRSRREIQRQRGRLIKSTGDGILATFDGPARAVRCAQIREAVVAESRSERESTPARSNFAATTSAASRCTSASGFLRSRSKRGSRVTHRRRPRRRIRTRVRRPRRTRAEGSAGRMASVHRQLGRGWLAHPVTMK